METLKKMSIRSIVLGLSLFVTGILYSSGTKVNYSQVQLLGDKSEVFELKTVANGTQCICELFNPAINGARILYPRTFYTANECNNMCANACANAYGNSGGASNIKDWRCQ